MTTTLPGYRAPGVFSLLQWLMAPEKTFRDGFRQFGDLYAVNNPLYGREVVVNHPELIKQIFTGDPDVYHAGAANFALAPVTGDLSVLILDGRPHHRMRKLLLPAFTGERLDAYAAVMREATRRVTSAWPTGEPLSVLPSMQRLTFDVILVTIFGVHEGAEIDRLKVRLLALLARSQSPLGMLWLLPALQKDLGPLTGWAGLKRSIAEADESIYAIIAAARAETARRAGGRRDVLSALLGVVDEEGRPMSDQELRDQLITLLLAGNETTALSLAWAVEEIARRPDVRRRILDEIAATPAGDASPDGAASGPMPRPPAEAYRAPMPYLDATIKEVLRLHPVTPLLARRLAAPVVLRGHEIPAGTFVVPNVFMAQRHPAYWSDPDAFQPERFLSDAKPDPYAWLPFGSGARRCIGMAFALLEMRVVLATMLSELRLQPSGKPATVTLRSLFFAPKGGTRVVLEGRAAPRADTASAGATAA